MRKSLLAAVAALALGGCHTWYNEVPSPDTIWHNVPWFDHMIYSRAVNPYSRADIPRQTPKGSVPLSGTERNWAQSDSDNLQYAFDVAYADKLVNPTLAGGKGAPMGPEAPRIPATLEARGDTLYQTYCSACHGFTGAGDGLVGAKLGAPSLMTDRARKYTDGYLYSIIKYGRGVMPKYGDKIYDPTSRWAVVNHLRKLQAAAPATVATGGQN
ncbi:MAG: cytochrome c [Gemmatimonadales bacterium]|nr:cytochrome c [Gemmatimonadales bacterium]